MSLLQLDDEVMPFTFVDLLILRFLMGEADAEQTLDDFETINQASELNWSFNSHLKKFIKRFWSDPYKEEEQIWMKRLVREYNIHVRSKMQELRKRILN